jgi:RND family efflux transporter MFP subunit
MSTRQLVTIVVAVALTACGVHDDADHDHDRRDHAMADSESWAVTAWGEHFGLFPEVDALVAGKTADAHVHVTILDGFKPAVEGSVAIVLTSAGGQQERFSSTTAVRSGIFKVAIESDTPGERDLAFEIEVGGVAETIGGGRVLVGTPADPGRLIEEPHALPEVAGDEEVGFLLEQQWRTALGTAWTEPGALRASVAGTARVEPPSGGEVIMTAPVDGVVRAASWPYTGQSVASGTPLMSLIQTAPSDRSLAELEASVRELEALSAAATARAERLEVLLAKQAVSQREVEQAGAEAAGLEARLEASRAALAASEAGRRGRGGVFGLEIAAPFSGRVAETMVSPGQRVAAGMALLRVVRERPVWVRVALTPDDAAQLKNGITGLILDTGGSSEAVELGEGELRLVAVAPEVNRRSGAVEVLVEVERTVDQLKPGLHAAAQVLLPGQVTGILLPDSAVVDDAGVPVVYVQLDGETFARRLVEVERRQGDLVLVDGVLPGERVVTVGGAAIRRASLLASGSVEGHVH